MFTVLFALGRLPGWIAQWRELLQDPSPRSAVRQIYTVSTCGTTRALSQARHAPKHLAVST